MLGVLLLHYWNFRIILFPIGLRFQIPITDRPEFMTLWILRNIPQNFAFMQCRQFFSAFALIASSQNGSAIAVRTILHA